MRRLAVALLMLLVLAVPAFGLELVFETDFSSDPGLVSAGGSWVLEDGVLRNKDIAHDASNGYIPVKQAGSKIVYEYQVTYKESTAVGSFGPLGGFVFMINDPLVKNDAYFLYGAGPFLKMVKTGADDSFSQLIEAWTNALYAAKIDATVTYRIEVNTVSGDVTVWANGNEAGKFRDPFVTKSAEYVSFRTNATLVDVHFLKVYSEQ